MTSSAPTRTIGRRLLAHSGVYVTELGFGGATIGRGLDSDSDDAGHATLEAAWQLGIRYFDTAPWYGRGLSELRVGRFLRSLPRDEFVLSTKAGRILRAPRTPVHDSIGLPFEVQFDYSYGGIVRAYEDSLQRLGLPRIDFAIVHDLDLAYHAPPARWEALVAQLVTSGWRALQELRDAGRIRGIGIGINLLGLIPRFLELFDDIDFFLLASRYTLMEQDSLDVELPACVERGVSVVVGAPFNSGILATGPGAGARYDYRLATPAQLDRVGQIKAVCDRYEVPLASAALQFALAHPAVVSVIPGPARPEEARLNAQAMYHAVDPRLWQDLKAQGLLRRDAPVPGQADREGP